jgi:hypothetical membrane protein
MLTGIGKDNKVLVAKLRSSLLGATCLTTLAGIIAPILLLVFSSIVETLTPGYNPIQETISRLVLGPYGFLQTVALFIFGLLLIIFAMRLGFAITSTIRSAKVGTFFFYLIGVGFLVVGIFPTNNPGMAPTLHAMIHRGTSAAIAVLFPFACLAVAPALKGDIRWKRAFAYTIATGIVALILVILGVALRTNKLWSGLYERVVLLNGLVWIELVSFRLLRMCIYERREARQNKPTPTR